MLLILSHKQNGAKDGNDSREIDPFYLELTPRISFATVDYPLAAAKAITPIDALTGDYHQQMAFLLPRCVKNRPAYYFAINN